jgi:hypothetical protein
MKWAKAIRLPGETPICRDCGQAFEAGRFAKYCPACRPTRRAAKRAKWRPTSDVVELLRARYDTRIKGRAIEIAKQLGWPKWAVCKLAQHLGLAGKWPLYRKAWTNAEIEFMRKWCGLRNIGWIAKQLGRPESAVCNKIKRIELSRRVVNGYSSVDVCRCFGMDHHIVDKWIRLGWLRATIPGGGNKDNWVRYSEDELRRFVRSHPLEFRLDKVDQVWFLGLMFGAPIDEEENLTTQRREGAKDERRSKDVA